MNSEWSICTPICYFAIMLEYHCSCSWSYILAGSRYFPRCISLSGYSTEPGYLLSNHFMLVCELADIRILSEHECLGNLAIQAVFTISKVQTYACFELQAFFPEACGHFFSKHLTSRAFLYFFILSFGCILHGRVCLGLFQLTGRIY